MKYSNAWRLGIVAVVLAATTGCGGGQSGATPSGEAADAETFEVISPEEAKAEADRAISQENADEAFAELSAEIEAELDDGG